MTATVEYPHTIDPDSTVLQAMERMTAIHDGLLPVLSADGVLFGVISDGDIRRAIIRGVGLDAKVSEICNRKPVTIGAQAGRAELIHALQATRKNALVVVDEGRRFVRTVTLAELVEIDLLDNPAVVMAGGFGTRLRPYTLKVPKPMLRIGSKPIIERIVENLASEGINRIYSLLHYLPEQFLEYFADKSFHGRQIQFLIETEPKGTAGGLDMLRGKLDKPFLVLNGDSLIRTSWRDMIEAHADQGNWVTIGSATFSTKVPYGVLQTDDGRITDIIEKPTYSWLTVCSTYLLSPQVLDFLTPGEILPMPDLIKRVISAGHRVGYFPINDAERIEDLAPGYQQFWEA